MDIWNNTWSVLNMMKTILCCFWLNDLSLNREMKHKSVQRNWKNKLTSKSITGVSAKRYLVKFVEGKTRNVEVKDVYICLRGSEKTHKFENWLAGIWFLFQRRYLKFEKKNVHLLFPLTAALEFPIGLLFIVIFVVHYLRNMYS